MHTLHILTPEYPPATGGVADYTHLIANRLSDAGERVHVWAPPHARRQPGDRFEVHGDLGDFGPADLARTGQLLDRFEPPRRMIVQWVPHGFGRRAMNVRFCWWLWQRAQRGDRIELMVHEPYLAFWEGTWRQNAAAIVHRFMTILLLRAAHKVWVAIPAWETKWKPYALGRPVPFTWLPISSALPVPNLQQIDDVRRALKPKGEPIVGHLGTYPGPVAALLEAALDELLRRLSGPRVVLMGRGSDEFCAAFNRRYPQHANRVRATGPLAESALAAHVAACDVLLQPYPDGISSRRTTAMAGLHLRVPVVTNTGALTEPFWETSTAVRLAPVGDASKLIDHVEWLLHRPDERKRISDTAYAFYCRTFDVGRTISALRTAA